MPERASVPRLAGKSLLLILAAALLQGCPPRKTVRKGPVDDSAQAGTQGGAESDEGRYRTGSDVDTDEPSIRAKEFVSVPDLPAVHFGYDVHELSEEARLTLRNNAAYMKAHPDYNFLVEGHCDDRGTLEYNLALGQKRASTVREYYSRLGVPARSIATLAYGEEKPVCSEATDACWAQNRRAETKVGSRVSSNGFGKHPTP